MLEHFSSIIIQFIASGSYLAIFVLMMLESALIPIPSEITMPFAGFLAQQGHINFFIVVFMGAAGNLAGSYLAYALGFYLEEHIIVSFITKYGKYILLRKHEYERAMRWFQKYGSGVVFFSRLIPGIRTFVSLPAGLAEMNLMKFSLYSFFGSLIWSALLTYIGYYLGRNWQSIHGIFSKLQYIIIGIIILAIVYYIVRKLKVFKRQEETR